MTIVLITGTSVGGMGYETARVLAKYANKVILAGSNEERYACIAGCDC